MLLTPQSASLLVLLIKLVSVWHSTLVLMTFQDAFAAKVTQCDLAHDIQQTWSKNIVCLCDISSRTGHIWSSIEFIKISLVLHKTFRVTFWCKDKNWNWKWSCRRLYLYLPFHTFTLNALPHCQQLFLFTAPLSNAITLGKCILTFYLQSSTFPFWDIRLIQDTRLVVDVQYEMKVTTGITLSSSGCRIAGPLRAAVMDIQMSMIRDIMICRRLSPAVQRLIVFPCLMRSCSFASFASLPRVTLSSQVMLWIFINVFHSTAAGLSHHQWPMPFIICLSEQQRARE